MNSKLFYSRPAFRRGIDHFALRPTLAALLVSLLGMIVHARAGDAPQWMHALVNAPLPEHDEKTNAVLLLAEDTFSV